jgi:uncharacterized protein (DUF2141 family)
MMLKQFGIILFIFFYINSKSQTSKIILQIENVNAKKGGDISTGIFIKKNFLKIGQQTYSKVVPVTANTMEIIYENIPAGEYAFVAFQDFDKNNKLETNFIGYPKEPVGFSNNAKIFIGPPSFDDTKVKIDADKIIRIRIKLK